MKTSLETPLNEKETKSAEQPKGLGPEKIGVTISAIAHVYFRLQNGAGVSKVRFTLAFWTILDKTNALPEATQYVPTCSAICMCIVLLERDYLG